MGGKRKEQRKLEKEEITKRDDVDGDDTHTCVGEAKKLVDRAEQDCLDCANLVHSHPPPHAHMAGT